ncbi:hypothetical protein ABR36_11370 [Enterobacter ludwigii]|nr:hypothetical protein ABR36_11370 [Enterobacter ludwigii]
MAGDPVAKKKSIDFTGESSGRQPLPGTIPYCFSFQKINWLTAEIYVEKAVSEPRFFPCPRHIFIDVR